MTAFFWHDPRPRPTAGVPRGKGLGWPLGCDEMGAEPTTVRARRVMPRVHCTRAQAIPRACAGREGHGGKGPSRFLIYPFTISRRKQPGSIVPLDARLR